MDSFQYCLSESIKQHPSAILVHNTSFLVERVHPRVIRVENPSNRARLALKRSNLSEALLQCQLALVATMRSRVTFIPRNFGYFRNDDGSLYEIWEWINPSNEKNASAPSLMRILRNFVLAANEVQSDHNLGFPNETQPSFNSLLESGRLHSSVEDLRIPLAVRRVISHAIVAMEDAAFLAAYEAFPRSVIHSDIRDENVVGDHLIDFSNAKVDPRVLEISRFLILNPMSPEQFRRAAKNLSIVFPDIAIWTKEEIELFDRIVSIDFSCVYLWAMKTVVSNDSRCAWASWFLDQCAHQSSSFGLVV